jgi:DNA mismatch repair protein MutL
MAEIKVLDAETIDQIAAGEVVERPSSVAKELVENAVDAGATSITVEIREGGIGFLRVTDNGFGMEASAVRTAFLRHATSKIRNIEDLEMVKSLGFRGEALSSIAAVSKVELITKTPDALTGIHFGAEGGSEIYFEEIGAPTGTTFIMRSLFFNTPVRKKFLKQPNAEGGYITEWMEHLALSRPDISFKYILGSQIRFHTTGNGDLREVIYRIFGKEILPILIPIETQGMIGISGYLGKPEYVRSNRSHEITFMNGRFIKNQVLAGAIEEGYKAYLMQHKFPFCVLHLTINPGEVDVNVHPAKLDVRFLNPQAVSREISQQIRQCLEQQELIPQMTFQQERLRIQPPTFSKVLVPEPFEINRTAKYQIQEEAGKYQPVQTGVLPRPTDLSKTDLSQTEEPTQPQIKPQPTDISQLTEVTQPRVMQPSTDVGQLEEATQPRVMSQPTDVGQLEKATQPRVMSPPTDVGQLEEVTQPVSAPEERETLPTGTQESLTHLLTPANRPYYRLIGQVFNTYWMIEFQGKLYIMDQHAAHEKVKYERLMKQYRSQQIMSQNLMPPMILSLTGLEESILQENQEIFQALGFSAESFGGSEYALRSVPLELYGSGEKALFLEVLDTLAEQKSDTLTSMEEKIASMSCKAAVKGNMRLTTAEAEALLDELLTLDNPYNCPHGRPTIITISKAEMEKKFKRIL